MVRLDWQGSWTRGRFHFTCCHSWIPSLSKVNKTKKCSVIEALLLRPRWHSFRGRIPGSAWRVVLGDTQKETPLNVMWNDCFDLLILKCHLFPLLKQSCVKTKRKWQIQQELFSCSEGHSLAGRGLGELSLCYVPFCHSSHLRLSPQKEALHFWALQQQLNLQLEQIRIACRFLWFGLGSNQSFMEDECPCSAGESRWDPLVCCLQCPCCF